MNSIVILNRRKILHLSGLCVAAVATSGEVTM